MCVGVNVPEPHMPPTLAPAEVRETLHQSAQAETGNPASVFIKGSQFVVSEHGAFRNLLSMDSVVYQGAIYRVRPCPHCSVAVVLQLVCQHIAISTDKCRALDAVPACCRAPSWAAACGGASASCAPAICSGLA